MRSAKDIPEQCLRCGHLNEETLECGINMNNSSGSCFLCDRITDREYRKRVRKLGLAVQEALFE